MWKQGKKNLEGSELNPPPRLNGVNQIYTEVKLWCCISKRNALTLIHSLQLCPFANRNNLKGDIEFSKKILTPFKIALPLHRFIKKFLKIFQAHGNYIASPPPLPPPNKLAFSPKQMDIEAKYLEGVLLLYKGKCVRILTTLCAMDSRYF